MATPQNKGNKNQHQVWIKQNTDANFAYFFTSEDDFYIYLTGVVSKKNTDFTFTSFSTDELNAIKAKFIADNQLLLGVEALQLIISNPSFVDIDIDIADLTPNTLDMRSAISLVLKEYLSLLAIKKYLSGGLTEIGADKLKSIALLAIDSNGTSPSFSDLTVTGSGGLDSDSKKPILGTIYYS